MRQNKIKIRPSGFFLAISILLILVMGLIAPTAQADSCTFTAGTVTLPPSSSVAANTTAVNAQGATAMACSGLGVSLLSSYSLSATIVSTTNNLMLKKCCGRPYSLLYLPHRYF